MHGCFVPHAPHGLHVLHIAACLTAVPLPTPRSHRLEESVAAVLASVASVREALAEGGDGCTLVTTGTLEEVVAGSSALRGVVRDTLHGGWGGGGGGGRRGRLSLYASSARVAVAWHSCGEAPWSSGCSGLRDLSPPWVLGRCRVLVVFAVWV